MSGAAAVFDNPAITVRNRPFKRPSLVQVVLTVSKPGEKADVPVGVIVGSVIAGLLLLALAVGLLWKVRVCLCLSSSAALRVQVSERKPDVLFISFS